jgi:hypothetical protein
MGNRGLRIRRERRSYAYGTRQPSDTTKTKCQGFALLLSFWVYLSVLNFAPTVYELLGNPDWERQSFSSIISTRNRIRIPADHRLDKKLRQANERERGSPSEGKWRNHAHLMEGVRPGLFPPVGRRDEAPFPGETR